MSNNKILYFSLIAVSIFTLALLSLYFKFNTIGYLSFSDAAKSADIARNLISGLGYNGKFSFWGSGIVDLFQRSAFPSPWLPPFMPYSIALSFKLFGISDFSVVAVSSFYFFLLVIFTYLLGKKIFNNLVGILSAMVVASSIDFLNYATNGSTESIFSLEIVASTYFLTLQKRWATITGFLILILSYFTRPQAFIYIAGLLLYSLLLNFKIKKALMLFSVCAIIGLLVDYFVMPQFAGRYFLYSVTGRGIGTATEVSAGGSASDVLRGEGAAIVSVIPVIKKFFYDLYNYYKLLPQILSPYLVSFFVLGLFKRSRDKVEGSFKIATIFMTIVTFLVFALSIPFFRYVHPVVPLIYIAAVATIVEIISLFAKDLNFRFLIYDLKIPKQVFIILTSLILIIFFEVGQTLGVIFLDSRFERNTHNFSKPPVYATLSKILRDNTEPNDFIVTNLDTWGSWYGDRRTIWFPLEPRQLVALQKKMVSFDAIYLTSYLINDQNYYMGDGWRQIFDNPKDPSKWKCDGCSEIAKEFKVASVNIIEASDNYEKIDSKAVLFIKK